MRRQRRKKKTRRGKRKCEDEENLHFLKISSEPNSLPSEAEFEIVKGLNPFQLRAVE